MAALRRDAGGRRAHGEDQRVPEPSERRQHRLEGTHRPLVRDRVRVT
jgi:hypothetical protein